MAQPEVEVAVLGPVEVRGAAQPFTRSSALELVVYLAFHRSGARTDVWGAALWPDRGVALSTLHSTASVARRSLGRSAAGFDHLPRGGRSLRLEASVATDVDRFAGAASEADPARWKEALGLVRGPPFAGLGRSDWAIFDGTQAGLESMVADTALKAAAHHLQRGDSEEAEWMVRQGLRVSPYDERLYRVLARAADAQGKRVSLRAVLAELFHEGCDGDSPFAEPQWSGEPRVGSSSEHPRRAPIHRGPPQERVPAAGGGPVRL